MTQPPNESKTESECKEPFDKSNETELNLALNLSSVKIQSVIGFETKAVTARSPDATELTLVPKLVSADAAGSTYPKKRPKYQATGKGTFS